MNEIDTMELTADEARSLTGEIRGHLYRLVPLVKRAYYGRADQALGYASWQEYCAAEIGGVRIPLADRPAKVAELRSAGMSTRAIGAALGVSKGTVDNDLAQLANSGQLPDVPERVVSLDGRDRPASRPDPIAGALAAAREKREEVERHNAWVRELNEQIPDEVKADVDELGRRIAPVTAIESGCRYLLDAVRDVDPETAIAEAPDQLRYQLDVVHAALSFLTRVADAMNPKEVAA